MGIDIDIRSVPGFSAYIAIVWIVPLASTLAAAKRLGKFGFRFVYILIPLASYATWSLLFFPGFFNTHPTWNFVIDPLILAIATPSLLVALAKFPARPSARSMSATARDSDRHRTRNLGVGPDTLSAAIHMLSANESNATQRYPDDP